MSEVHTPSTMRLYDRRLFLFLRRRIMTMTAIDPKIDSGAAILLDHAIAFCCAGLSLFLDLNGRSGRSLVVLVVATVLPRTLSSVILGVSWGSKILSIIVSLCQKVNVSAVSFTASTFIGPCSTCLLLSTLLLRNEGIYIWSRLHESFMTKTWWPELYLHFSRSVMMFYDLRTFVVRVQEYYQHILLFVWFYHSR